MPEIKEFSRHAVERISEILSMTEEEFWEILRKADDLENSSVRWTTKNIKPSKRQPDRYRLYIHTAKKSVYLVIRGEVLVTLIDIQNKSPESPDEQLRYKTLSRILEDNGLPKMTIKSFRNFEEWMSNLSTKKRKQFRIRRAIYRFPIESSGKKFYVFYSFQGDKIFAPYYPTPGMTVEYDGKSFFNFKSKN